jgi:hypothetical protein
MSTNLLIIINNVNAVAVNTFNEATNSHVKFSGGFWLNPYIITLKNVK